MLQVSLFKHLFKGGRIILSCLRCFDAVFRRPYCDFSIALKVILSLSDRYEIFNTDWLWFDMIKVFQFFLNKIDITMTTAKKNFEIFVRYWPATENPTLGTSRVLLFSKIFSERSKKRSVCLNVQTLLYIFNSRYELIFSSIRMLLNIIFRCKEFLVYFLPCDLEN